jgi:hypothetical protein
MLRAREADKRIGAVEKTRTFTGLPPLRPERSASTNSATTAWYAFLKVKPKLGWGCKEESQ